MSKYGCKRKDAEVVLVNIADGSEFRECIAAQHLQAMMGRVPQHLLVNLRRVKDPTNWFPDIPWADGYGPKEPKYKEGDLVRHWSGARGVYCGEYAAGHRVRYFDGVERYYRTLDQLGPLDPDPDILAAYEAGKRCHE